MSTPHNSAAPGDFAKTVLMPGDPLRAQFIAENFLNDCRLVNNVRGIQGYTGTYNGLYHKGTGTPRKTQARAPFAAQTDRERRKRAEMKSIQRVFGSSSDLHPVFLLFVRGRFRTAQVPDCPVRKQERSFATFYTNRLQNSMRKGAAA